MYASLTGGPLQSVENLKSLPGMLPTRIKLLWRSLGLRSVSNRKLVFFWLNTPSMTLWCGINAATGLGGVRFLSFPILPHTAEAMIGKYRNSHNLSLASRAWPFRPCRQPGTVQARWMVKTDSREVLLPYSAK